MAFLENLKKDLPAGLVVFLVALPLCLGIALASGAPLVSGLISGIVGGIIVGSLSSSHLSVSGPAAGLALIVLEAIHELDNSFELFLTCVILAGVIQLILGFLNAGIIGLYFPVSVIKGMLSAIGIFLIMKQLPHFVGLDSDAFGEMRFVGTDGRNTFQEIVYATTHINTGALIVGVVSLTLIIVWDNYLKKKISSLSLIPGALIAVLIAVLLNYIFASYIPAFAISTSHLVNIPRISLDNSFIQTHPFPDFSYFFKSQTWEIAVILAVIASLETLLSVEAVDKLDPHKRHSPQNRELKAQGVGNIISGFLGGLPITAVIVRSSANLEAGAASKMSAVYHGILLLICVLLIPNVLNMIPLSALAAVLLVVGFKLTRPSLYRSMYRNGLRQFVPFLVTIVSTLFTDLLIGIGIGLAVGIFYILKTNLLTAYFLKEEDHPTLDGHKFITLTLSEHVTFLNKAGLQVRLDNIPPNSELVIDGSNTIDIDFDVLNVIHDFEDIAKEKNINLSLLNIPSLS